MHHLFDIVPEQSDLYWRKPVAFFHTHFIYSVLLSFEEGRLILGAMWGRRFFCAFTFYL